ncbi:SurA N-terminal domain-containing protein [Orbus wheelerorum]|uniref:SurA N-terminal domain-containing protein n=1 Tax=Orbus wheelerorum TaxID=3074111 RepID=UPI00370D2572
MMEKIRTAANSIIVKIIFSIIILAFIFTGVGGFLGFGSSAKDEQVYIAKVDGEGISRNTFEKQAQELIQKNSHLIGDGSDDSFVKMIRASVLSNQIDNYLAYKFADSLNANISDEQVKMEIRKQPVFFENGRFNNQRYLQLLAANGYTPDTYADGLRSAIKQQQVMDALFLTDFVLPTDSDISLLDNQTRAIYLANYSIDNINDNDALAVSDDEIKNYYDTNKQEFYHDKRVKMKFVTNFLPAIKQDIQVLPSEVEKYYADSKDGTMIPEKRLYSVLSFTSLDAAQKEYNLMSKMQGKQRSSTKMDSLGWFALDEKLPELLTKIKLDTIGSISKPLEQDGDFYIIRLDQIEKAKKLPFEYAKASIHDLLYQQKIDKKYREQQTALEKAAKLPTLDEIAKKSGLPSYDSDWTYEKENFSVGRYPEINDVAFSDEMIKDGKPTGKISDIINIAQYDGSYIIQVTDYQDAGISTFEDVKDSIKAKLIAEKKKQIFSQKVATLLAQLKQTGVADGLSFAQKMSVTQNLVDDRINEKTVKDVFATIPAVEGNSYGVTLIGDDKAQFFVLTGVTYPEKADDLSEKIKPEMLILNRNSLAKDLRSKAEIKIMPNANL